MPRALKDAQNIYRTMQMLLVVLLGATRTNTIPATAGTMTSERFQGINWRQFVKPKP